MVRPAGSRVSQLDYFAVLPEYRSAGLGAQLLADLPQHERGAQAILIEAECPDKAEDEAMAVRRLGFTPGAARGTPASPSTCLMHGSAFWCWTARVPVPLRTGRPWMPWWTATAAPSARPSGEVRAVLLPGRNKILLSRRRSMQIMCTERLFCHIFVDRLPKSGTLKHRKTLLEEGNIMAEKMTRRTFMKSAAAADRHKTRCALVHLSLQCTMRRGMSVAQFSEVEAMAASLRR